MGKRAVPFWIVELRGPRRWKAEDARRVLEEWGHSGESIPAFARRVGLVSQRLYWWRERLEAKDAPRGSVSTLTFVPMTVRSEPPGPSSSRALVVTLSDDVCIEVLEVDARTAAWVSTLVRSMRGST